MLTVTALAAEKLKEVIQAKTTDPEICIRLIHSPSKPNRLNMTLDKEKEDDQVIESEGAKILLLSPELTTALERMVVGCQETPQGVRFTITKLAPDTKH